MEPEVQAERIQRFWEGARGKIGFGAASSIVGLGWADAIAPEAWAFGHEGDTELADELLGLVLSGIKTGTASLKWEYADEPLPKEGDLSIILDGAGEPRAIIRTTSVAVIPFAEVTAEHARAEGEGDRTLETWRADHEGFWRRGLPEGQEFSLDMPVVCERFELVYPKPGRD
ncbi:MAG: ASCH domain-containing protein [Promicromonosporaceae bacterium]|nr:ASCH domain-containing protein [Promicromonosporaceae bacterium]